MFAGGSMRCRILLADDVAEIRNLMRVWLSIEGDGFEIVGEAADGAEAVALADEHKPHVAILDLSMPRMDGLTAIGEIRRCSPATKIMILSGFDAAMMSERALEQGADLYIEKGSPLPEITHALRGLCPR